MQAYCRDDVLGFNLNLNLRAAIVKNEKSWSLKCVFLRLFLCSFVSGNFSQKKFFHFEQFFFAQRTVLCKIRGFCIKFGVKRINRRVNRPICGELCGECDFF